MRIEDSAGFINPSSFQSAFRIPKSEIEWLAVMYARVRGKFFSSNRKPVC
jgi:hypothetical protein